MIQPPDRPMYPPFRDPEDWRRLVGGCSESIQTKGRQLVADATADHALRHTAHDHPWCKKCHSRLADEQDGALETETEVWAAINEFDVDSSARDLALHLEQQDMLTRETLPSRLDDETKDALIAFAVGLENLRCRAADIEVDALAMACRYLVVHGRQPVDPWPNLPVEADLDSEYLTRDQLDELPEAEPLIETVLPRHAYGILRGRKAGFKSFVALDWALHLAMGRSWQGNRSERVKVLYIVGEGAHGIGPRVDAWEAANGVKVDDEWFVTRKSALNLHKPTEALDHLLARIESEGFGLVVIDTLRRVSGAADGNGSEMGLVVDNIERIKRATAEGSVLVIAHTGKDDKDSRGFSGIEDDADVVWHARRDEMIVELECVKFKDGPDGHTLHVRAKPHALSLAMEASAPIESGNSEHQSKILQTLISVFPDGAPGTKLLEASGVAKTSFYRALADLREAGHVINTGTAKRPFYERVRSGESQGVGTTQSHESQAVPNDETPSDQQIPKQSHLVPVSVPPESQESHPPIGVGRGTGTDHTTEQDDLLTDLVAGFKR